MKMITVQNCMCCPFFVSASSKCRRTLGRDITEMRVVSDKRTIPDWCPLPDAEQKEQGT